MKEKFSVAISYNDALGYIEYDEATKGTNIVLGDEEGHKLVFDYLHQIQTINIPHNTLMDFTTEKIDPLASVDNLKTALTRLWNVTQVHVDWSRPVDYVRAHPHY